MAHASDSPGTTQSQIITLTERITSLTAHLKENAKDHTAKKGLLDLVSKRKGLLKHLEREDSATYESLCDQLRIRRRKSS